MKSTDTLTKKFTGHGHYKVTAEIDGKEYSTTVSDMTAIDAAFDEDYDLTADDGRYYESQKEAQEALVNAIIRNNNL